MDSSLNHVLVVGGNVEQWELMEKDGWAHYVDSLRAAVEHVGAKWLTIYPHSGSRAHSSNHGVLARIADAVGGKIEHNKVVVPGKTTVVFDSCADGRERFVHAVNSMAEGVIKEDKLAQAILQPAIGEPDLVVIFGSPEQLPESLVWELAYSELVFLQTQWPKCNSEGIELAINDFQRRDRRFGGVDS